MTPTTAWLCLGAVALASLLVVAGLAIYWQGRGVSLLGPLFRHEVVLLVRRPTHFLLRTFYPTTLLVLLAWVYLLQTNYLGFSLWDRLTQPVVPVTTMATFSQGFFLIFAGIQFLFLCILTVRVSAAAIAEDRERHRLDFLLSTPLENHEIVLGKLAARLATAFLLALAALPIISFLPFFGGVDPLLVIGVTLFTFLSMVGLAALGGVCSIHAENTRRAMDLTISSVILYHFVSGLPYAIAVAWGLPPGPLLDTLSLLNSGNVVAVVLEVIAVAQSEGDLNSMLPTVLLRYAIFQALVVLACGRIAVVRLRAAARLGNEKTVDPLNVPLDKRKNIFFVDRPPVSDEPILWKAIHIEGDLGPRHGQRIIRIGTPMEKSRAQLVGRCLFVGSMAVPIVTGFVMTWRGGHERVELVNMLFRFIGTMVGMFCWIRMAGLASATIAGEREQRTLGDLFLTNLERREILRQKWRGAMYLGLWPMVWVAGYGVLTVAVGSLHVLALPLFLLVWLLYAVFLVNLALWFSAISPTKRVASRRLLLTVAAAMVGTLVLYSPLGQVRLIEGLLATVFAPLVLGASGLTSTQLVEMLTLPYIGLFAIGTALGLWSVGLAAGFLWRATVRRFEAENAETVMSH